MRTWADVYSCWVNQEVKKIEVVDYNESLHDRLYWSHKRKKSMVSLGDNAKNDTAKAIRLGRVTANDELYAAFALKATLKNYSYYDSKRKTQLWEVVSNTYEVLHEEGGAYWYGTSKHVLPYVESLKSLEYLALREELTWESYIQLAAKIWTELAEGWVVVKFPEGWG